LKPASAAYARPLLAATVSAIRAWRAAAPPADASAGSAPAGSRRLVEAAELGQSLWPLMPVLCAAGATPAGGEDGALALGVLREICDGLLSPAALAEAAKGGATFLPPLAPPRRRRAARGAPSGGAERRRRLGTGSSRDGPSRSPASPRLLSSPRDFLGVSSRLVSSFHVFSSLPFAEFMDEEDEPLHDKSVGFSATALRPFLDAAEADAAAREISARSRSLREERSARKKAVDESDENVSHAFLGAKAVFGGAEVPAALALCLDLARGGPEGADALHRAGLLPQLGALCERLCLERHRGEGEAFGKQSVTGIDGDWSERGEYDPENPAFFYNPERAYRLALRVAATLAGAASETFVEADCAESPAARRDALDALVSFATRDVIADRLEDALAPAEVTSASLAEAETSAAFLHALATAAEAPWQIAAPKHRARARAAAAAFLQWVASPPPRRGVACAPATQRERELQRSPPLIGCSTGWFLSCAIGSAPASVAPGAAAVAAAVAAAGDAPVGDAHSETLAARFYATAARCAAFLAAFPRVDTNALVGREALESLERQAVALKMELDRRAEGARERSFEKDGHFDDAAVARAFGGALRNVTDALFRASSELARLEDGEASPYPPNASSSGRLDASFSLITQMSWKATPAAPAPTG
jgi:nuclear pore complex protein Nup188